MNKEIDSTKTVYQLSLENPEFLSIMREIGFENILDPGMLNTAGRIMTLEMGAKMKKIELKKIKETFEKQGFQFK